MEGEAKVAFILFLKKLGSRVSARLWRGLVQKRNKKNVAKKEGTILLCVILTLRTDLTQRCFRGKKTIRTFKCVNKQNT